MISEVKIQKASHTINGKAFEWAVAKAIQQQTDFTIVINGSAKKAQQCFEEISPNKQLIYNHNAELAIQHILAKEEHRLNRGGHIEIAEDKKGQTGDVRDVIIILDKEEIGFSCKTNHEALKHSRLSGSIDFVKEWGLDKSGCSQTYWNTIGDLFKQLKKIRLESNNTKLWRELDDVPKTYYWPLLDAFVNEIERLKGNDSATEKQLCNNLLTYLIGRHDFYKIISRKKKVEIQAFNFNGTLSTEKTKLPDSIVAVDNKNGGQYSKTIRFSRGYTINFRIHTASSKVEASLKFDINAIGIPHKVYKNVIEHKKNCS